VRPLAFRLDDGRSYTYTPEDDGFTVAPATSTPTRGLPGLRRLVRPSPGAPLLLRLFYADKLTFPRGPLRTAGRWEPTLRVAFDGQAITTSTIPTGPRRRRDVLSISIPLHPRRSDAAMVDFIQRAGFLHLRDVVGPTSSRRCGPTLATAIAKTPVPTTSVLVDDRRRRRHLQPGQLPERPVAADRRPRRRRALFSASEPWRP